MEGKIRFIDLYMRSIVNPQLKDRSSTRMAKEYKVPIFLAI